MPRYTAADWPALRALGPADAARTVRALCDHVERDDPAYGDGRLVAVGIMMSGGSGGPAEAVLDWLEAAPSAVRAEIACALLRGLWFRDGGARAERLAAACARLEPDGPAAWSLACALFRAGGGTAFHAVTESLAPSQRARLRALLREGDTLLTYAEWRALDILRQPVAELTCTAAALLVEETCERFARAHPEYDADELLSTAAALARRQPLVGDVTLDWLEAAPAPSRLEVGCVLLQSAWAEGVDVPERQVARLLAVCRRLDGELDAGPRYHLAVALEFAAVHHPDRALEEFLAVTAGLPQPIGDMLRARFARR
ncbi:hypothetical protein GCM10009678_75270 [Actinomadura kijaniata]|uniref:Uncharacterized protein n=1 Tax=Actinomadura namibiensis TaxID=182080 RepID=A0A7W3QRF0_ACTNM|nr:hypothetical protein [Actinomadura namibiensis]MBA8956636.1 hypothetical protein [Actinomadura namibiensis]